MNIPVVAILGRPNVGKSTLFNRIIRKREAIVDDKPGVTRDRIYAQTDWAGKEFDLIDTGGYVPASDDVFERAIREQVEMALREADVIVFVTDVKSGLSAMDEEISSMLLKAGIKVVLAVNKVDNDEREANLTEFYSLGLGEPHPISAISGRQIGDLLDAVVVDLPSISSSKLPSDTDIKLAVLGKPNVGKSSYVNAILGEDRHIVTEIPGTTRDAIDTRIVYNEKDIVLIDTAGLRKKARVKENIEYFSNLRTMNALRRCDVAIIFLDAVDGITDQDKKIISSAVSEGKGIVLGVNKWDLIEKDTMTARKFELDIQDAIANMSYIPIMFISALVKQRIFRLLDLAISIYKERQRVIKTAELNRLLRLVVTRNQPASYGSKHVKINYVTQARAEPPTFVFFTNEPKGIKKNYRNYLENQIRKQYGFLGVPIRMSFRQKN